MKKRWGIFFELLCMIFIGTTILSAVAFGISWAVFGRASVPFEKVWDFSKFVGGPLFGAGIAFYVNDRVHRDRKREDEKRAASGAAFALARLYGDFMTVRYSLRRIVDLRFKSLGFDGRHHVASYFQPHRFTFGKVDYPDLPSLRFLLSEETGRQAFAKIQAVIRIYMNLVDIHDELNKDLIEFRDLEEKEKKSPSSSILNDTTNLIVDLVHHLETDERQFVDCLDALREALVANFSDDLGLKEFACPDKAYLAENLPPWPPHFISAIQKMSQG
ncbi:hypothetical protein [Herbaspirillum sp. NPDC087042]|uniref:hypothetical protein n=1 Tax=Herbaspirillum sp. NPDC087042 TaxID=3364004 RepID=UPI0037FC519E